MRDRKSVAGEMCIQLTWSDEPNKWRDYEPLPVGSNGQARIQQIRESYSAATVKYRHRFDIVLRVAPANGGQFYA
jgi:hypothetical protein